MKKRVPLHGSPTSGIAFGIPHHWTAGKIDWLLVRYSDEKLV